jgi:hypothetical protein
LFGLFFPLVYFEAIWYISWLFGIFVPILVFVLYQEKPGNPGEHATELLWRHTWDQFRPKFFFLNVNFHLQMLDKFRPQNDLYEFMSIVGTCLEFLGTLKPNKGW